MGPKVLCIGLNPSTADAHKDDRTITNLVALLDRYGYGELCMMNLFALVSKDPQVLRMCPDPVKDNDEHLRKESVNAKTVIFCWGSFPIAAYRAKVVTQMFPDAVCFGKSSRGNPLHPLAATVWMRDKVGSEFIKF